MDGYVAFLTIYTYTSVYLIDCYGRSMCPLFPAHCHCVAFFLDKITERYWLWFLQRTVRVLFAAIPSCTRTIPLLFRSDWYGWWEQLREHIGLQPSNQMKEYSTLGILDNADAVLHAFVKLGLRLLPGILRKTSPVTVKEIIARASVYFYVRDKRQLTTGLSDTDVANVSSVMFVLKMKNIAKCKFGEERLNRILLKINKTTWDCGITSSGKVVRNRGTWRFDFGLTRQSSNVIG